MSAWQDIFSLESWEILTGAKAVKNTQQNDIFITAEPPKGKGAEECVALIAHLTELIKAYHEIPKTEVELFTLRISMLDDIRKITTEYINLRGEELQKKQGRKLNPIISNLSTVIVRPQINTTATISPVNTSTTTLVDSSPRTLPRKNSTPRNTHSPKSGRRSTTILPSPRRTNSDININKSCLLSDGIQRQKFDSILDYAEVGLGSMDQWIESLHKRTIKKTEHLNMLARALEVKLEKDQLVSLVKSEHQVDCLFPGVILEKIDTYHREIELQPHLISEKEYINKTSIPMNKAFSEWANSNTVTPFFLDLERHPISTAHKILDSSYQKVNVIDYNLKRALTVEIKNHNTSNYNVLMAKLEQLSENQTFPLNTQEQIVGDYIDCVKPFHKAGSTAYAWDIKDMNKFITHPHKAGQYHHASLFKGGNVRCAGMWVVKDGIITYIDNSSGHYKPTPFRLYELVIFLRKNDLMDVNAEVCEVTVKSHKGNMRLDEYLNWAKQNLLELKEAECKTLEEKLEHVSINVK